MKQDKYFLLNDSSWPYYKNGGWTMVSPLVPYSKLWQRMVSGCSWGTCNSEP